MSLEISTNTKSKTSNQNLVSCELIPRGCPQDMSIVKQGTTNYICWFPMRVPYSREIKLKAILDARCIESFIPMQRITTKQDGRIKHKYTPAIHNLIFINSSKSVIDQIKQEIESTTPMRFIMDKSNNKPIIIPQKQMEDFVRVSNGYQDELIYLNDTDLSMKKGERVRINQGVFEGVEGKILRIKGNKRVVVSIEGIAAVAIMFVHKSQIQKIE